MTPLRDDGIGEFLELHAGLVHKVVSRTRGLATPGFDVDDMIQEGMIGLVRAARNWDASRGLRFSSYAVPCIEGAVRDAWRVKALAIRSPSRRSRAKGAAPVLRIVSIDAPAGLDGSGATVVDTLADAAAVDPEAAATRSDRRRRLAGAVAGLGATERTVLALRYGLGGETPLAVHQVAARLGLTATAVRRSEAQALLRLRSLSHLVA